MSRMYDLTRRAKGPMKWSTYWDIRSVGLSLAEQIGRPGTGVLPLWIFGRR